MKTRVTLSFTWKKASKSQTYWKENTENKSGHVWSNLVKTGQEWRNLRRLCRVFTWTWSVTVSDLQKFAENPKKSKQTLKARTSGFSKNRPDTQRMHGEEVWPDQVTCDHKPEVNPSIFTTTVERRKVEWCERVMTEQDEQWQGQQERTRGTDRNVMEEEKMNRESVKEEVKVDLALMEECVFR